jgi:cobalt/nickel transport system permease protein
MHLDIDRYAHIDSPVSRWDPRCKIVTLLAATFCVSALRSLEFAISAALISYVIMTFARLPVKYILGKIWIPIVFLIPLFIFLPVSSGGTVLYDPGFFKIYSDGILLSILIMLKIISTVLLFIIMLGTTPFNRTAKALQSMKMSPKLSSLILFSYRYIFVYLEDLRKMRSSLALRGYRIRNSISSLKNSARLIGTLLVRSFEQTERIYRAMILRGFEGEIPFHEKFDLNIYDFIKSAVILFSYILIVMCDMSKFSLIDTFIKQ